MEQCWTGFRPMASGTWPSPAAKMVTAHRAQAVVRPLPVGRAMRSSGGGGYDTRGGGGGWVGCAGQVFLGGGDAPWTSGNVRGRRRRRGDSFPSAVESSGDRPGWH
jgi:hypothetical protein